jgi:Mg2+-importing ATPase
VLIVNGNLALGAARMAREKCIIKRLEAIQNIGAMTVLCTDKTGTLTADQVEVHSSIDTYGDASPLPLSTAYAISKYQKGLRNVMDESILRSGDTQLSLVAISSTYQKITELPFDFVRRMMSVLVTGIQLPLPSPTMVSSASPSLPPMLLCKGAFDEVVAKCTQFVTKPIEGEASSSSFMGEVRVIGDNERAKLASLAISLPSSGLRIIAVAYKPFPLSSLSSPTNTPGIDIRLTKDDESDLILAGFLTFADPPKADARETLAAISALGVKVKVLSGDNPLVANNVCQQLGLDTSPHHTLTGDELFELTADDEDPELRAIFQRTVVFARLNPSQKARVVGVLRDMGHTVGFMGDGINDTLAIREADVGISVDSGSDLAKDAADVILTEKNLSVIHSAIVTGRRTHGNTVKYIYMAASSNFGNVFSLLVAAAWLPFLPSRTCASFPFHLLVFACTYHFV